MTIRREDCYHTTFEDFSFDVIVLGNVLHIVERPLAVVKEASRLLKPGGRLLAVDYTSIGMSPWQTMRMAVRYLRAWGFPPSTSQAIGPQELRQLAAGAGLEVVESGMLGTVTKAACLVARKSVPS